MLRKFLNALRLYRSGIFRIYLNKLFPNVLRFQTFIIYHHNLDDITESRTKGNDINFIKVEHSGDELFKAFQKKFPAKEFENRVNRDNQTCYLAFNHNEVAGYGWLASRELFIDSINYNYPLKNDELFIYACYVSKDSRGMGIYPLMLQQMLSESRENGYKRMLIGVNSANTGSIKGIEKAGFKPYKKISYVKIGSYEWWKGLKNPPVLPENTLTRPENSH